MCYLDGPMSLRVICKYAHISCSRFGYLCRFDALAAHPALATGDRRIEPGVVADLAWQTSLRQARDTPGGCSEGLFEAIAHQAGSASEHPTHDYAQVNTVLSS